MGGEQPPPRRERRSFPAGCHNIASKGEEFALS